MKKILSLLLVALMIVGMLPMNAIHAHAATESYVKVTAAPADWSGNYLIVYEAGNVAFDGSLTKLDVANNNKTVAITDGVIAATDEMKAISFTIEKNGSDYTIKSASGYYIGQSSNANGLKSSETTTYANTISINADYSVNFVSGGAYLRYNSANDQLRFRYYKSSSYSSQKAICLYKLTEDGEEAPCTHEQATISEVAATCTADGSKTVTCDCGYTETTVIPATGHSYVDGSCSACGEPTPAAVATKITTAAEFTSGEYVMVVSSGYAMGSYDSSSSWVLPVQPIITGNDVNDAAGGIWTLTVTDSSVTIQDANGVYIAPKGGNNNGISTGEYSWDVTVNEDGTFTFAGAGEDTVYLASNTTANSGDNKFRAYKTTTVDGNATGYLAKFDLYKVIDGEGEEPACEHTNTTTTTVDATCTAVGSETVVCNDCGETVSTTELPVIDHTYVDNICSVCGAEFEGEVDTTDPTEPTEPDVTEPASSSATISFADTTQRVSQDTSSQVWANGGATVTNNKASSTSNIIDSSNPVRFYKSSEVIIAFTGMTKIVVDCNSASYATALSNSISDSSVSVSVSEDIVTIVPNAAIDSYTITLSGGQVRVDSITVSASSCEHSWGEYVQTTAPTCTVAGVNTSTCSLCGETKTDSIPATGHTYTYVDGSMTCTCGDVAAFSTIAEAKAYTSKTQLYYIKGIVTYVNGKNVYIEDATGGICVYFAAAPSDIALGDEIVVWDTMTTYNGLIETTNTTALEYLKVSSGNALPSQTVTIADLNADTTNEYLGERVVIENVTIGVLGTNNTALTDADGNTINIYKAPTLNAEINENDIVTVTAIVSTYNAYQLFVNSADDVVEVKDGAATVIETVSIATAKAGTAGEYYQVEGTVTYISGRNVYIQDATGGIVVYLTADAATTQVGNTVKAYGALKLYNGLIELDAVDETNAQFYEILSSGNTVDAQEVTIEGLLADTSNEYLAEKITLNGVYVSYNSYNSSYGNVTYTLTDGNDNQIEIYRVTVASEEECVAGGSIVNVEAIVSSYNEYQLVTTNDKITVIGTCAHETTELVNASTATCTEAGYTGDTMCTVCQNYTARGEDIAALGHTEETHAAVAATCTEVGYTEGTYCTVCQTYTSGHEEIAALDHDYQAIVTAPTCTEQGYSTYTCSRCGEVDEVTDYVNPTGHNYVDGTCSVCGEADPDYTGPIEDANLKFMQTALSLQEYIGLQGIITKKLYTSYDKVYVETVQVTPDGEEIETLTPMVYMTNYYVFDKQVLACSMTEEVTMTLYAEKDGVVYIGETVTTSVEQKALSMLATYSSNASLKATCTLLVDMLNYGAEVQKAFKYNTGSIPDASAYATLGTAETPAFSASNSISGTGTVNVLTHSVSMQAKVEVQMAFRGDVSAYELRYTVDGETTAIPSSEFGTYYGYPFVAVAIKAANMRKPYTIALYDPATNEPVTPVYTTSIEGFAQTQLGGTYNDVFIAMMKYGDAVAAL